MTPQQSRYKKWYEANKERVREMKRASMAERRAKNPDLCAAQYRKDTARLRGSIYAIYGDVCAACGFADKRSITLDHKLNNGNEERRQIGERGVYRKAVKDPDHGAYQILCMNCQFIKHAETRRQCAPQPPGGC